MAMLRLGLIFLSASTLLALACSGSPQPEPRADPISSPVSVATATTAAQNGDRGLVDSCKSRLRIMTFNVLSDRGLVPGENAWSNQENPRRDRVIETIRAQNPDLLGLQEAQANQLNDLLPALDGYTYVGTSFRANGGGENIGVFYRTQAFTEIEGGFFWLSDTPDVRSTAFAQGRNGHVTWVVLEHVPTARKLAFYTTHWSRASGEARLQSAILTRTKMEELTPGLPSILTGDLNATEEEESIGALLAPDLSAGTALIDAYRQVHPSTQPDEATAHGFTGGTAGPRIDYILHNGGFSALQAEVDHSQFGGLYPSDHYALVVELGWAVDSNGNECR